MKRAVIERIVAALQAKTQNEQLKHGAVKRRRDEALDQAEHLRAQAATARTHASGGPTAGLLLNQQAYCENLTARAKKCDQAASDLVPALAGRREKLEGALQREIVAEKLLAFVRLADRKRRLDLDEQSRDMTLIAKRGKVKSRTVW